MRPRDAENRRRPCTESARRPRGIVRAASCIDIVKTAIEGKGGEEKPRDESRSDSKESAIQKTERSENRNSKKRIR